jgi:transmembrane sensor
VWSTPPALRPAVAVDKVTAEAMREELAWQGPRLIFSDTPLVQVVAEFNRRNQVQLVLADAELETMPVGGSFRAENVEAFVRLIAGGDDITVERPTPERIVLRKAR